MDKVAVIFTPYAVTSLLVGRVMDEISQEVSSVTLFRRKLTLHRKDVEQLYPLLVSHPLFPKIVSCFTSGEAELLLITGVNVCARIRAIKGLFRYNGGKVQTTGLRKKYQKDEFDFEFIFHTTDSEAETEAIFVWLFSRTHWTECQSSTT